jgi:aromatic ring-opening dioxygenase catalytic subunit (LigB family)
MAAMSMAAVSQACACRRSTFPTAPARVSSWTGTRPPRVFDYYGFPRHTYQLEYPAPGSPELAARMVELLGQGGTDARIDGERGFDHGVFIPLKLMFPGADIPVVQLSLRADLEPHAPLDAGRALAPLREEGVLVVGSGMSFHNMRGYGDTRYTAVSAGFDAWLSAAVESPSPRREERLANWTEAPGARLCHPPRAEEHLVPLMVAAGAAGDSTGRKVYSEQIMETTISAFRFE